MSAPLQSLASAFHRCRQKFDAVLGLLNSSNKDEAISKLLWEDEASRFRLWGSNIGAAQSKANTSLDFRLRDADTVRQQIYKNLNDLGAALQEAFESINHLTNSGEHGQSGLLSNQTIAVGLPDTREADQTDDAEASEPEEDLRAAYDDIVSLINLLFRMTLYIRNPSRRDQLKYRDTSAVATFEAFDVSHIENKFPTADSFLTRKLGQANTVRRANLRYWERHHKKLAVDETVDDGATVAAPLSESIATAFKQVEDIEPYDTRSHFSGTSYMGSMLGGDSIRRPDLPKEGKDDAPFQCPICCYIIIVSGQREWMKHVFFDLQPYVCTFRDCKTPLLLYENRRDWFAHVLSNHLSMDESGLLQRVECPLCHDTVRSLPVIRRHLARHLEEVALFSLPNSLFGEETEMVDDDKLEDYSSEELEDKGFPEDEQPSTDLVAETGDFYAERETRAAEDRSQGPRASPGLEVISRNGKLWSALDKRQFEKEALGQMMYGYEENEEFYFVLGIMQDEDVDRLRALSRYIRNDYLIRLEKNNKESDPARKKPEMSSDPQTVPELDLPLRIDDGELSEEAAESTEPALIHDPDKLDAMEWIRGLDIEYKNRLFPKALKFCRNPSPDLTKRKNTHGAISQAIMMLVLKLDSIEMPYGPGPLKWQRRKSLVASMNQMLRRMDKVNETGEADPQIKALGSVQFEDEIVTVGTDQTKADEPSAKSTARSETDSGVTQDTVTTSGLQADFVLQSAAAASDKGKGAAAGEEDGGDSSRSEGLKAASDSDAESFNSRGRSVKYGIRTRDWRERESADEAPEEKTTNATKVADAAQKQSYKSLDLNSPEVESSEREPGSAESTGDERKSLTRQSAAGATPQNSARHQHFVHPKGICMTCDRYGYHVELRPPDARELFVMREFASHASHCSLCADPLKVAQTGDELCESGQKHAQNLARHIYSNHGRSHSVIDRDSRGREVEIGIPAECEVIRDLIKAVEKGLNLRSRKPIVIEERGPTVPDRRAGERGRRRRYNSPEYDAGLTQISSPRRQRSRYGRDEPELDDRAYFNGQGESKRGSFYDLDEAARQSRRRDEDDSS